MGSLLTPFKWPEGQIRKFLATVTVVVLVAVAVGATAPAVGAADPTAPGAPTQLSAVWSSRGGVIVLAAARERRRIGSHEL